MFVVLTAGGLDQVGLAARDDAGGIGGLNFHFAAFQELEQALGVFFFLQSRFRKDVAHEHVTVFLGLGGEVIITVTGLGLTGERGQNIFFGLGAFQRFHNHLNSEHAWHG